MNKKAWIFNLIGSFILIFVLVTILSLIIPPGIKEYKIYKEYKVFCEERPTFCYCSHSGCEFKTSWSSQTGFSKETIELCNLAKKLNDKVILFRAGCD